MSFVISALMVLGLVSGQASAETLTTLVSFNYANGANPLGSLTLNGSTLYGMTNNGGANGYGNIFSIPVDGGIPTVLASFDGTNGRHPVHGSLTLSGSTLYGTTHQGGAGGGLYGYGTVFSIPVDGGIPTVLVSFNDINGKSPQGSLILIGSTLYGTTAWGGAGGGLNGHGTVFSLTVPEPSTLILLCMAALGLLAYAWRRHRS